MNRLNKTVAATSIVAILLIGAVLAIGDRAGVPVTSMLPADGSTPPVTTTVVLEFGTEMDQADVEDALSITPQTDYTVTWAGRRLTMTFPAALQPGQTYSIHLTDQARSLDGRHVRPRTWSFTPREADFAFLAPASEEIRSLWVGSLDGETAPVEVFAPENGILNYSAASDGSQIAVSVLRDDGGDDIWLVDRQTGSADVLLECAPASCSSPAFSPDGRQIAYEYREPDEAGEFSGGRIYLFDLAGGGSAPVYADETLIGFEPVWSPDGKRLAFIDAVLGAIRVVDLETHEAALMPSDMGQVGAFAPDGSQMIYTDLVLIGGQFFTRLFYVDLNGDQGVTPLLADAEEDRGPAWSPQGRWLIFGRRLINRSQGFGAQIMLLDLETGDLTALTDDPVYNNLNFVWDPTGRYVLFSRFELGAEGAAPGVWVYDTTDQSLRLLAEDALGGEWLP